MAATKKRRVGRPSKLTPEVRQKVLTALKAGNFREVAAGYAGIAPVTLDTAIADGNRAALAAEPLRVDEALAELEKVEPRLARVVEMRYFAGLSELEIAAALGLTDRTVRRDWQKARLLLHSMLEA